MLIVFTTFTLPKPITREEARSIFLSTAPKYRGVASGASLGEFATRLFTLFERNSSDHTLGLASAATMLIGPLTFTQLARSLDFIAQAQDSR